MVKQDYVYNAYVTSVYDGDTITVDIDLGFDIVFKGQKIRLYGINAPEMKLDEREAGIVSRDWLREKILNKNIVINTFKDSKGKYGRWLADIYIDDVNINKQMITEGLAKVYGEK